MGANERFKECTNKAYENFMKVFRKGDDRKKPDWLARKSCNYLTESVETCGNKQVGVCFTQDEVDKKKDEQLKIALEQVRTNIPAWDSNKCPAIKSHLDRLAAATAADDASAGAASLKVSILSIFV